MRYEEQVRTRGTECGPDRWVTLPAVVSLMEHLRWEWLRVPEIGLLDQIHEGHGFFVTEQRIAMARRFGSGADTTVSGVLRSVGRVKAIADQAVVRADGVLLAHCRIEGVWTGPGGRLARIPRVTRSFVSDEPIPWHLGSAEAGSPQSLFDPPQPLRDPSLEIPLLEPGEAVERRLLRVRHTDCDVFSHVNAANYVRYVADALADRGASPSLYRARLVYRGQARAGDEVVVASWPAGSGRWGAVLTRDDEVLFRATVDTEV